MDIIESKKGSRLVMGDWHHEIVDERSELTWKSIEHGTKYW
jgi:hypothetical protein